MFAVLAKSYEYDDNRYSSGEGYAPPTRVFKTRESAEKFQYEMDRAFFIDNNLYNYYEEYDWVLDKAEYKKFYDSYSNTILVHYEITMPPDLSDWDYEMCSTLQKLFDAFSDEEWKNFRSVINETPYSIFEVEVED